MALLFIETWKNDLGTPTFSVGQHIDNLNVIEINVPNFLGMGQDVRYFYKKDRALRAYLWVAESVRFGYTCR